ncbi:MAG: rhomboid family intramembrane serine protease [Planctomycetes bacterium]|nr:rhomboid family intramembrane serine protease [Planctomycetota bacterium]
MQVRAYVPSRSRAVIAIIAINILVFVAQGSEVPGYDAGMWGLTLSGGNFNSANTVEIFGVSYAPAIRDGEYWRIPTSMFLHGGLFHIGFNMYALWMFGSFVVDFLGVRTFLLCYFGGGIVGGAVQMIVSPQVPCLGASGGVFAVLGAFFAYFYAREFGLQSFLANPVVKSILTQIVLYTLFTYMLDFPIGHGAHIGGVFAGFAIALGLIGASTRIRWSRQYRRVYLGVTTLICCLIVLIPCLPASVAEKFLPDGYVYEPDVNTKIFFVATLIEDSENDASSVSRAIEILESVEDRIREREEDPKIQAMWFIYRARAEFLSGPIATRAERAQRIRVEGVEQTLYYPLLADRLEDAPNSFDLGDLGDENSLQSFADKYGAEFRCPWMLIARKRLEEEKWNETIELCEKVYEMEDRLDIAEIDRMPYALYYEALARIGRADSEQGDSEDVIKALFRKFLRNAANFSHSQVDIDLARGYYSDGAAFLEEQGEPASGGQE